MDPLNIEPSTAFPQGYSGYFSIENSLTESQFDDMDQYTNSIADQDIFQHSYPGYDFPDGGLVGQPATLYAVERPDTTIIQQPHSRMSESPIQAPRPLLSKIPQFHSFHEWQQPSMFVQANSMESLSSDTSSTSSNSSFGAGPLATQQLVPGKVASKQEQPHRADIPSGGRSSDGIMAPRQFSQPMPDEPEKPPVSVARPEMYTPTSCPNPFESFDLIMPTSMYTTTSPSSAPSAEAKTVFQPRHQTESQQSMPVSVPMAPRLYSDPTMYVNSPAASSNLSSASSGRDLNNRNLDEMSPILAFRKMAVGDGQGVCNPQLVNGDMSRGDGGRVHLQGDHEKNGSERSAEVGAGKASASTDEWRESDLWDDDYAEDDDEDDEDYNGEGDDDDDEYVVSRRRSFVAGSSHNLRPRQHSWAGMASARYHPYPDSSDASNPHSKMLPNFSSTALMSLPKPKVARQANSLPIPVPNLTKKSRGRRVPTVDSLKSGEKCWKGRSGQDKNEGEKNARTFICDTAGCGKCFARGEHLKRHVRSIHTHEKRKSLRCIYKMYTHNLSRCSPHLPTPRLRQGFQPLRQSPTAPACSQRLHRQKR